MEDNLSQISEQDVAFHQERTQFFLENSLQSPYQSNSLEEIGKDDTRRIDDNVCIMQRSEGVTNNNCGTMVSAQQNPLQDQNKKIKTESSELTQKTKKSFIIRHPPQKIKIRLDDL